MTDIPPGMTPPGAAPPVITTPVSGPVHRDRGGFLMFLGIVEITLGGFFALFGLLSLWAVGVAAKTAAAAPPLQRMAVWVNLAFYVGSVIFLVVMGIGTMRVRRWARVLMLIVSWSFFVTAIFGVGILGALLPGLVERAGAGAATDPAVMRLALWFTLALSGGMMIGLPLFFILAYSGRHVRHTFAVRHPEPAWVDRCPTSVLSLSLLMVLFGLVQIAGSWSGLSILFGVPLEGPAAVVTAMVLGTGWMALGYGLYRLNRSAWLASLGFVTLVHISGLMTYRRMSLLEMTYRLGGGAGDAAAMGWMTPLIERWSGVAMLGIGIGWIVSLLAIRRHFHGGAEVVGGSP